MSSKTSNGVSFIEELMVAVAIVGLLAAVALPGYVIAQIRLRQAERQEAIRASHLDSCPEAVRQSTTLTDFRLPPPARHRLLYYVADARSAESICASESDGSGAPAPAVGAGESSPTFHVIVSANYCAVRPGGELCGETGRYVGAICGEVNDV